MPQDDPKSKVFALEQEWTYKVTVLADLVARRVAEVVQRTSGLNLSQWRVMAAVADRPGRTASEVVDVTPMDKGIVSRAVSSLVERGLVERRASQQDGRVAHLHLTDTGGDAYQKLLMAQSEAFADGRWLLTEADNSDLLRLLEHTITAYREAAVVT